LFGLLWIPNVFIQIHQGMAILVQESIILLPIVLIGAIINIGLRLGWVPLIPNYLYQSPVFDVIASAIMITFLFWNIWSLHKYSKTFPGHRWRVIQLMIFILNLAILFGVAEWLINIQSVLLFLPG
jgi:hypothetical protein